MLIKNVFKKLLIKDQQKKHMRKKVYVAQKLQIRRAKFDFKILDKIIMNWIYIFKKTVIPNQLRIWIAPTGGYLIMKVSVHIYIYIYIFPTYSCFAISDLCVRDMYKLNLSAVVYVCTSCDWSRTVCGIWACLFVLTSSSFHTSFWTRLPEIPNVSVCLIECSKAHVRSRNSLNRHVCVCVHCVCIVCIVFNCLTGKSRPIREPYHANICLCFLLLAAFVMINMPNVFLSGSVESMVLRWSRAHCFCCPNAKFNMQAKHCSCCANNVHIGRRLKSERSYILLTTVYWYNIYSPIREPPILFIYLTSRKIWVYGFWLGVRWFPWWPEMNTHILSGQLWRSIYSRWVLMIE